MDYNQADTARPQVPCWTTVTLHGSGVPERGATDPPEQPAVLPIVGFGVPIANGQKVRLFGGT